MVLRQANIKTLIDNAYKKDRLSHAYLFYGDDGVGKKEMALYLACKIYCEQDGCMECQTCKTIMTEGHLNVSYIGVLENKKLVSKEQITDLQEEFSRTSLVEGPRVYIVDGIDTASIAAQNSLLKFIEEPDNQEQTFGLFLARDLGKVVSTIKSRCSLVYFPTLDKEALIASLEDIVEEDIKVMLAHITNSAEEIRSLYADEKIHNTIDLVYKFMKLKNSATAVLFYINHKNTLVSPYLGYFLRFLIIIYEDILHLYAEESLLFYPLHDKIEEYKEKVSYNLAKENLETLLQLESRSTYNVIDKNILHELIVKFYC